MCICISQLKSRNFAIVKKLRSIVSILLATLVVVSSLSFVVEQHFCLGQLVDTALFGDASCHAKKQTNNGCEKENEGCKHNCCADQKTTIEGESHETPVQEKQKESVNQVKKSTISAAILWVKHLVFSIFEEQLLSDAPPLPTQHTRLHVVFSTFLL